MEDELKIGLALSIAPLPPPPPHHHKLHTLFPPKQQEQEQEQEQEHEEEEERRAKRSRGNDRDHDDKGQGSGEKKKLRLTLEQATLLEDTFREHNTLTSFQKQELASKLKLKPRQVEVWFQNRRARNKLKQTELDFQMLKKWCENLKEENRRLKKELQELKLMKKVQSDQHAFYLDLPKVTVCAACGTATTMANSKKSAALSGDSSVAS